jgi:hypothetical protein
MTTTKNLFFLPVPWFEFKASCLLGRCSTTGASAPFGFIFLDRVLHFLPGLASNCHPPYLCLLSGWNYRSEPPHWASPCGIKCKGVPRQRLEMSGQDLKER